MFSYLHICCYNVNVMNSLCYDPTYTINKINIVLNAKGQKLYTGMNKYYIYKVFLIPNVFFCTKC